MDWVRLNVRIPPELAAHVERTRARLGLKQSEFIRSALTAHVVWHQAIDAAEEATGKTLDDLRDPETIARLLGDR